MLVTDFFKAEYVDYSSYDNLRKIASVMDGQKNASRKVLYTMLEKNITSDVKVTQLSSRCEEFTEYLHGSIAGVLTNMAQSFPGSNNLPLLQESGNFGTRHVHEASAARYIYASLHENSKNLFCKLDTKNLINQYFEGNKIEPQFYVPTLPVLLINGSEGVSSGFAQKILPRNPKDVKKAVQNCITGGRRKVDLTPYYEGFSGTVEQGETSNRWLIKGKIKRLSPNRVEISEVPIGYDLKGYIKVLDDLEDAKFINSYIDRSENPFFSFEVKIQSKVLSQMSDEELMQKLKLIKKVSENYTCIDENNKIKVFDSAYEIVEHYTKVKTEFMAKRYEFISQDLAHRELVASSKYEFIKLVTSDKLIINKRKKADIVSDLDKIDNIHKVDDSYDYLLNMRITTLTDEKMKELAEQLENISTEKTEHELKTPNDLWLDDLKNF